MNRVGEIDKVAFSTSGMPGGEVGPRHSDRSQGAWINYQMKLRGVTQEDIAANLAVSRQMVQRVAYGVKTSARVQKAIAEALGYAAWSELVARCTDCTGRAA